MTEQIISHRSGAVCTIEINRPDKKNAFTAEMYTAFTAALIAAGTDAGIRAIVLRGKTDVFTAGNDLRDFIERTPTTQDAPVWKFLVALSGATKPLIAAVAGPAVGLGSTMLLHCELVYAAPNTRFAFPFVSLGLSPEAASSLLLPLLVGYPRAAELLLLAEPFGAEKAREYGLINDIVPEGELFARAEAAAQKIAAMPPGSIRAVKSLLKRAWRGPITETMAEENRLFVARLGSAEAKEAFAAFFEKRKPDFSRFS